MNLYEHVVNNLSRGIYISQGKMCDSDRLIKENAYLDPMEEINPFEKTQQENKLLKAQIQAASDRSDFLEDCIAEMATLVYNNEETT